jgi:hypothetical protein
MKDWRVLLIANKAKYIHDAVSWVMTLCCLVGGYQSFAGTQCLHPQGISLKMEAACSSKMVASTYQTTRCHNPEDCIMNLHCHKSLKPYKAKYMMNMSPIVGSNISYTGIIVSL